MKARDIKARDIIDGWPVVEVEGPGKLWVPDEFVDCAGDFILVTLERELIPSTGSGIFDEEGVEFPTGRTIETRRTWYREDEEVEAVKCQPTP